MMMRCAEIITREPASEERDASSDIPRRSCWRRRGFHSAKISATPPASSEIVSMFMGQNYWRTSTGRQVRRYERT